MRFGSLFSGVGGIDLGLERAGHRVVFQAEADPYRRRVLARHWPGVPCFEDVRDVDVPGVRERLERGNGRGGGAEGGQRPAATIDLLCGGFPCQDLSVAGRRAGLIGGERSSLFFECARVADALLPDGGWLLIENVPGLLSSNDGRDFAVLLATLAEIGFHDLAWRVLDSRYLGVPQRRRRVFILARRSRGRSASEVLLEPESGGGDFEAGREKGARVAASLSRGSSGSGGPRVGAEEAAGGHLQVAPAVTRKWRKGTGGPAGDECQNLIAHTLRAEGFDASEDGTGRGTPLVPDRVRAPSGFPRRMDVGAFNLRGRDEGAEAEPDDLASLRAASGGSSRSYLYGSGDVTDRCAHDPKPDGPRYAACGDAVTVPVAEWIGQRLLSHIQTQLEEARP